MSAYDQRATAILASNAPPRTKPSNYPEPFASRMAGRVKRPLGDLFGIANFGVNLTRLPPKLYGAPPSPLPPDELVYVLEGSPTLVTDTGETLLCPGMAAGFAAGGSTAHHLENRTSEDCVILEVGDRMEGDEVSYPADDLKAVKGPDGGWQFARKNGVPY